MADKRQQFRFGFPWRKRGSQVAQEPRPTSKTQKPAQPTPTVAVDRSPFRPAGVAPVKASPSQAPPPPRTEPPPQSPSPAVKRPQKTSGATTETQIRVEASPPPVASQTQAASQESPQTQSQPTAGESSQIPSFSAEPPSSASKPEPKEAVSQSSGEPQIQVEPSKQSPYPVASQPQSTSQESPQTQSQPTTQESSQIPSFSAEPPSTASKPEPKEAIQSPQREPQQNTKTITSEAISTAESNAPRETTVQTHAPSAEAVEAIASPKKVDPYTIGEDHKHPPVSETESKEHKEGEKVVQLLTKEEKINDPGHSEPMQETHAPQAEQRHKKQETFDRKETLASTSSSGIPIKTPTDRSPSRISPENMVSSSGKQAPPHKETREDVFKLDKLPNGHQMLDKPVSVITLSGENRGASMQSSTEPAKEESVHIHRSYKSNPDDSLESTTDGEESNEGKIFKDQMTREDQQGRAYINSNVQSINNAIVFNSSVTERNPGVQAVFPQSPAESIKSEPLETHNSQSTKTPSEKLTHESTVRRRCLRGLFLESSDSDPDNPEKPRRHGCRYVCGEKRKDSGIGTL